MTNNPLPAALASIKRYGPTMILFDDGWKAGMSEKKNGEFYPVDDIAQLFATLPPPADGAVAWRWKFNDGSRSEWARIEVAPGIAPSNTEIEYAYAAPPADSAMDALQGFIDATTEQAARDAYDAYMGVSEWQSFVPRHLVAPLERARALLAGRK